MAERKGLVTGGGGAPLTLVGDPVKAGDRAPSFTVRDNDLNPVGFDAFQGKTVIIAAVPSLDTPVCDLETRRFNREAAGLGPDVVILTISMDLPFAQKRWCGTAGVDKVTTLSDYYDASFGTAYGVLVKELRLLARSVFVIDKNGTVRYAQLVPALGQEPDYDAVLRAVKELA